MSFSFLHNVCVVYFFLRFSACIKSVIGRPEMPQVPTPTLPPGPSGVAKIDFFTMPPFLVLRAFRAVKNRYVRNTKLLKKYRTVKSTFALKLCHLFFSASLASSSSFILTCFFCFFCFKYSRCFCNCSFLMKKKTTEIS